MIMFLSLFLHVNHSFLIDISVILCTFNRNKFMCMQIFKHGSLHLPTLNFKCIFKLIAKHLYLPLTVQRRKLEKKLSPLVLSM